MCDCSYKVHQNTNTHKFRPSAAVCTHQHITPVLLLLVVLFGSMLNAPICLQLQLVQLVELVPRLKRLASSGCERVIESHTNKQASNPALRHVEVRLETEQIQAFCT